MDHQRPDNDFASPEWFDLSLQWIATGIEGAGIAAIVVGALIAVVGFARELVRGGYLAPPYHSFRRRLARSILLGLEFLIAADIIRTVAVQPTLENLAVLAIIVLIRTFLSFSLEVEIEGRWPWQRAAAGEPERTA